MCLDTLHFLSLYVSRKKSGLTSESHVILKCSGLLFSDSMKELCDIHPHFNLWKIPQKFFFFFNILVMYKRAVKKLSGIVLKDTLLCGSCFPEL